MFSTPDRWLAIDFETTTPNKYACRVVCCGWCEFDIWTGEIRVSGVEWDDPKPPLPWRYMTSVVMHNADFDWFLLHRGAYKMQQKILNPPPHDTYLMAKHWRNDLPSYSLKALAWYIFGETYPELGKLNQWFHRRGEHADDESDFDMSKPPRRLVEAYCLKDMEMTARLACWLYPRVKDNFAYQQDVQINPVNIEIENNGITVNKEYLHEFIQQGQETIRERTEDADRRLRETGILTERKKPTGDAVRRYLSSLGETRKTPKSRKTKADDVVLRDWAGDPIIDDIQEIRSMQKQVNTYAKNMLEACGSRNFFHPNLALSAAITRRFRSWNLYGHDGQVVRGQVQNLPRGRGIRDSIVAPQGFSVAKLDLASIEARLGAHAMSVFLKEPWFCRQYRLKSDFNIYLHVARECAGLKTLTKKDEVYQAYKHACLGIQYGVGVNKFYITLHDKFELPYTLEECTQIYDSVKRKFPMFRELQRAISKLIEAQGFIVDDFGAIYYVPKEEQYKGVNYYCQGCAGNILKWWVLEIAPLLTQGDYIWGLVHDEVDLCVREKGAKSRVRSYCRILEKLDLFDLPIVAEWGVGKTWADCN